MKRVMKITALTYFMVIALAFPLNARVVDRIVAVVNDEVITLSELDSAVEPYLRNIPESEDEENRQKIIAETRSAILNKLINDILLRQEAKRLGLVVKEEDVAKTTKDMISSRNISMEDLEKALAKEGTSLEAYKKEIEEHLLKMKLIGVCVKSKISVTDEEIGAYYRKHRSDYEGRQEVRIKQILIVVPEGSGQQERRKLKAKAGMIYKRLIEGEPFELLASRYSDGPSARTGGDLGFIEKGVMFPSVDKVAFSLKNGEVSDVIESPVGFHIIKVTDRRGAGVKSLELVREEIREKISNTKVEKKFFEWIEELRKKSYIEIRL